MATAGGIGSPAHAHLDHRPGDLSLCLALQNARNENPVAEANHRHLRHSRTLSHSNLPGIQGAGEGVLRSRFAANLIKHSRSSSTSLRSLADKAGKLAADHIEVQTELIGGKVASRGPRHRPRLSI